MFRIELTETRRRAVDLLEQQIWCWGRDASRPGGNLLLEYGLCRHGSPDPQRGATFYTTALDNGAEVWLWGFGVLYFQPKLGGVFLQRYGFDPLLVERPAGPTVYSPDELGLLSRPATAPQLTVVRGLVCGLAEWIARYEHWIAESVGLTYRASTLEARSTKPKVPAAGMAAGWDRLSRKSRRLRGGMAAPGPWGKLIASLGLGGGAGVDATAVAKRSNPKWPRGRA